MANFKIAKEPFFKNDQHWAAG